ncbi:MAG: hypothetical protein DLM59_10855 [Pseudonocardiales bacterium]|nr:MAG: hypothetical protein DLM59_10855 [Pseudonocardiales bacterium]
MSSSGKRKGTGQPSSRPSAKKASATKASATKASAAKQPGTKPVKESPSTARPSTQGGAERSTATVPASRAATAASPRAGYLAGALVLLVGLGGLWHATQSTAAAAPKAPGASTVGATVSQAGIVVRDAYLKPNGPTDALVYFTVTNQGTGPDFLTAVSSEEVAHDATLYLGGEETSTGALSIGGGSTERLVPGGPHVRLGLYDALLLKHPVTLTLKFTRAGTIKVRASVRA